MTETSRLDPIRPRSSSIVWTACGLSAVVVTLPLAAAAGNSSTLWAVYSLAVAMVAVGLGAAPGLGAALIGTIVFSVTVTRAGVDGAPIVAWHASAWLALAVLGGALHRGLTRRDDAAQAQRERLAVAAAALDERDHLLAHALRMETVGGLAGMVAHQLRNHLQVMLGDTALGRREGPADKDRRFNKIAQQIDETSRLLSQLLNLAHPEDGTVRDVDLRDWCGEFAEHVRSLLPAGVTLVTAIATESVPVRLDPRGLDQALLNLCLNARQAMAGDGRLTISLRRVRRRAVIEVSDDGSGIAAENIDQIFEPYFTTKPEGEGTGLGLAAVRQFVCRCDGYIRVASEPDRGTTFSLEFPLRSNASVMEEAG